jgi:hypothetical protein
LEEGNSESDGESDEEKIPDELDSGEYWTLSQSTKNFHRQMREFEQNKTKKRRRSDSIQVQGSTAKKQKVNHHTPVPYPEPGMRVSIHYTDDCKCELLPADCTAFLCLEITALRGLCRLIK